MISLKKCAFVIPYFGKFRNYFQLFLNSCKYNKNYDWLFITDNQQKFDFPFNVKKIYMTFDDLKKFVQSKFSFHIELNRPYKLCDLKPAYGYIFHDLLRDYQWWGNCDTDTIMGNLNHFITTSMLNTYDKMFCLGHFIMYKNTYDNNRIFMSNVKGNYWYKKSFSSNEITKFDETWGGLENINELFRLNGKNIYEKDESLNFNPEKLSKFIKQTYNYKNGHFEDEKNYKNKLIVWKDGVLRRYTFGKSSVESHEYMYLHLQNRSMDLNITPTSSNFYTVIPNEFNSLKKNTLEDYLKTLPEIQFKYRLFNFLQMDKLNDLWINGKKTFVKFRDNVWH